MPMYNTPLFWIAALNILTGAFSALAGFAKALKIRNQDPQSNSTAILDTSNPWLYVAGGLFTVLLGIGNLFHMAIATAGTAVMVAASLYNCLFGAGSQGWRRYTLIAYVLVVSNLITWSLCVSPR